jgi:SAM-dependent methyltransferase
MHELEKLVDLTGLTVADVGAGTGRATVIAARKAKVVFAIDAYESVAAFGKRNAEAARLENVNYIIGDSENLPLENNSVDAVICAWAKLDYGEAYRVLRHNGYLIQLNCAPGSQCGELTATLAESYPGLITEVAPRAQFERFCPSVDSVAQDTNWNGVPLVSPMKRHDFTYVAEYGSIREASEMFGRLYGPLAKKYIQDHQRAAVASRLRICYGRVNKQPASLRIDPAENSSCD